MTANPRYRFEVCANGVESCLAAQQGGAHRVELCTNIPEGGTTPSYGEIKQARRLLRLLRWLRLRIEKLEKLSLR